MTAFLILAFVVLLSALAVVVLSNPLHSALCLALNLVSVAAIYSLLGAHFLAAVQVIVYAGAIMVLVVFVLMLLNIKNEERSIKELALIFISIASAAYCGFLFVPRIRSEFLTKLVLPSSERMEIQDLGFKLFSEQAFLFQLTGVILLTAIVGAVMLASQRKQVKSLEVE